MRCRAGAVMIAIIRCGPLLHCSADASQPLLGEVETPLQEAAWGHPPRFAPRFELNEAQAIASPLGKCNRNKGLRSANIQQVRSCRALSTFGLVVALPLSRL